MSRVAVLMSLLAGCASGAAVKPDPQPGASGDTAGMTSAAAASSSGTGAGAAPSPATTTFVYVAGGSDTIRVFLLDPVAGTLVPRGTVDAPGLRPGYGAFSPDKRFFHAAGRTQVMSFAVDAATGALTALPGGPVPTGGNGAPHIAVHGSGRWVVVPHFGSSDVSVLPVGANGAVGPRVDLRTTPVQAHQAVLDGDFLFIPCRDGNAVAQLRLDPATGTIGPNSPADVPAADPTAGPRHMAFHPSMRWAYVLNEKNGTLTTYRYERSKGLLVDAHTVPTVPDGVKETASAHVLVHPGGRFLYASNRRHNSIASFALDPATGRPTLLAHETADINTPRDFGMDPSGRILIVANQKDGTLLVYRIDAATGALSRVGAPVTGLGAPQYVGIVALP